MRKYLIILMLFSTNFSSYSQNNGEITYKVDTIEKSLSNEKKDNNIGMINDAISENINRFNFKLQFLKNESLFKELKTMDVDESSIKLKIARAMLETKNQFYINANKKIRITSLNAYGQQFIIKDSLSKWTLHKENKKIDDYLCYRATTERIVKNSKGVFKKNIEAWYAPGLTFSFGPKGYGGLPGLILVLKEDKYVYTVIKIDLRKEIKSIEIPSKGKLITREELLKIGEESSFQN